MSSAPKLSTEPRNHDSPPPTPNAPVWPVLVRIGVLTGVAASALLTYGCSRTSSKKSEQSNDAQPPLTKEQNDLIPSDTDWAELYEGLAYGIQKGELTITVPSKFATDNIVFKVAKSGPGLPEEIHAVKTGNSYKWKVPDAVTILGDEPYAEGKHLFVSVSFRKPNGAMELAPDSFAPSFPAPIRRK